MIENTDLISKKAAYAGIAAAITMHIERAEKLAAEASYLKAEIEELENNPA